MPIAWVISHPPSRSICSPGIDRTDDQGIDRCPHLLEMAGGHRTLRHENLLALGTSQGIESNKACSALQLDLQKPSLRKVGHALRRPEPSDNLALDHQPLLSTAIPRLRKRSRASGVNRTPFATETVRMSCGRPS